VTFFAGAVEVDDGLVEDMFDEGTLPGLEIIDKCIIYSKTSTIFVSHGSAWWWRS
jgi:hypothetical protein